MSDEKKRKAMIIRILEAERENLKTGEKTKGEMVDLICRIIQEESKRND